MVSTARPLPLNPVAGPRVRVALALGVLYVIWSSTYLALRYLVTDLPTFGACGVRFVLAGGLLLALGRARGERLPTGRQWLSATLLGSLFFLAGNAFVARAERELSSGIAALMASSMPLYAALFGVVTGERLRRQEVAGLVLGFVGVAVLVGSLGGGAGTSLIWAGLAPVGWAVGTALAKKLPQAGGSAGTGAQLLMGGVVILLVSVATGERVPTVLPVRGLLALAYLVVLGSIAGFSAYRYLLEHARRSVATSYAYVNPFLALLLGAVVAGESIGLRQLVAGAVIAFSVGLILTAPRPTRS